MTDILNSSFFEWLLPKALIGIMIGFFLRIFEHYAWLRHEGKDQKMFFWSLVALMQSICVGGPLAYVIVGILAHNLPAAKDFITGAAYLVAIFTSFIAIDVRELVRRIKKA